MPPKDPSKATNASMTNLPVASQKSTHLTASQSLSHLLYTDPKSLSELYLAYCADTRLKHITKQHRRAFEKDLAKGERESMVRYEGEQQQASSNSAARSLSDPTALQSSSPYAHFILRSARAAKQTAICLSKILAKPEYSPYFRVLDLHENVIRDDGCIALVQNWLRGPHLRGTVLAQQHHAAPTTPTQIVTKLDLGSNDISPKGLVPLIEYLMDTSLSGHLKELILGSEPGDLYANKMDTKTACLLAKALEINHSIQVLNLNRNTGIGKRSQKAFKRLALAFQKNESLRELRLGEVDMSTQSAIQILLALANHENLQVLDLHGNGLTAEIAKPLRRVIVPHRYEHAHQQDTQHEESAAVQIESLEKNMDGVGNYTLGGSPTKDSGLLAHHAHGDHMKITTSANPFESDDSDGESEHDDELFADNVQESKLSILLLNGNHIGAKGMRILFPALKKNNSLTILNLASNNIGDEGATHIAEYLQSNNSLTHLNLQDNQITEPGTIAIASALSTNNKLTELNLSKNKCGDQGVAALGLILRDNKALTSLNISLTACGDAGALTMFQSLATNRTLTHLNMASNHLSEDSGIALEQALRKATENIKSKRHSGSLKSIILTGNQIDHTTLSRVKKIIFQNKAQQQQQKPIALQRELIRLQYITEMLANAREEHDRFYSERRKLEAELATVRDHQQEMLLKIEMQIQEQRANIDIEQNTIDDNAHKMRVKAAEFQKAEQKFLEKIADFEALIQKQLDKRKALQETLDQVTKECEAYSEDHVAERVDEVKEKNETVKSELSILETQKEKQAKEIEKLQAELEAVMAKMDDHKKGLAEAELKKAAAAEAKQKAAEEEERRRVAEEEEKKKAAEEEEKKNAAEEEEKKAAEEEKKAEQSAVREEPPSLMEQVKPDETAAQEAESQPVSQNPN